MLETVKNKTKHLKMKLSWYRAVKKGQIDCRIPPQNKGYNNGIYSSAEEYCKEFVKDAYLKELPALLGIVKYDERSTEFSILDYGCGLGRLACAFTNFFGTDLTRNYFGYEVHPDAFNFLTKAYSTFPNARFFSDQILVEESYVEVQERIDFSKPPQTSKRIKSDEIKLKTRIPKKIDLQYTHSVFTHMVRPSIVNILKEISSLLKPEGVCVNTWLIIDKFSESSVRCGLADRALPYEIDGYLTYSKENPLVCSAYRLETIKEIYHEAGHEILDIKWGAWSGRVPTQNFTYIDVVISRPIKV